MAAGGGIQIGNEMSEPIPLILTEKDGNFRLNHDATKVLSTIEGPLTVIGIAGKRRKGKSYLGNWFLKKQFRGAKGFPLGSSMQSQTKGIWFGFCPHPKTDGYLVILDTEGLGDPKNEDPRHELNIFMFTVLMSSYFIFNSEGSIDNDSIKILHFVEEMAENVRLKANQNTPSEQELSSVCPAFCWLLRNFFLDCDSPKEYMEKCLELKEAASGPEAESCVNIRNQSRKAIKKYFPNRNCFTLPQPAVEEEDLQILDSLQKKDLRDKFCKKIEEFCNMVLDDAKPYTMNDKVLTGTMWLNLLEYYVKVVNEGRFPVIENAFKTMARSENERAVREAMHIYKKMMDNRCSHELAEKKAMEHFRQVSIKMSDVSTKAHEAHIQMELDKERQNYHRRENPEIREVVRTVYLRDPDDERAFRQLTRRDQEPGFFQQLFSAIQQSGLYIQWNGALGSFTVNGGGIQTNINVSAVSEYFSRFDSADDDGK